MIRRIWGWTRLILCSRLTSSLPLVRAPVIIRSRADSVQGLAPRHCQSPALFPHSSASRTLCSIGDNLTIRVDHRSFSSKWFILCEGGKSHCVSIPALIPASIEVCGASSQFLPGSTSDPMRSTVFPSILFNIALGSGEATTWVLRKSARLNFLASHGNFTPD